VNAIDTPALAALIQREMTCARRAGRRYIRDEFGFESHLLRVGRRSAEVAGRLRTILPSEEAPDPVAAFIAGAWHDGGKIWHGDDYHEITSALAVLEHGVEWELARGPRTLIVDVLKRSAAAIVPHFAILEQWRPDYVPSSGNREGMAPMMSRLRTALRTAPADRGWLLPLTVDALVLMYSDLVDENRPPGCDDEFESAFALRWDEVSRSAGSADPALASLLPRVRPRAYAGCALIQRFLTRGYDEGALRHFRKETLAAN
jgi:hypothetical protein